LLGLETSPQADAWDMGAIGTCDWRSLHLHANGVR